MPVELSIHRITTEGKCAAFLQLEVFTDNLLHTELIDTFVHRIGAIHVEVTFVVIVGSQTSGTCKTNVIAHNRIHDDAKSSIRRHIR